MTASQFLGAFNDNAFKQVVVLLAAAAATTGAGAWVDGHPLGGALPAWLSPQALPPFLFSLPFVLLWILLRVLPPYEEMDRKTTADAAGQV